MSDSFYFNPFLILKIHRLDFDTAVLAGPDADGDCGTANDELTITSPSTTIPGVANLCGTLTGQHCMLKSLTSEAIPSATQFFMRAYKISHFPGL